MPAKHSPNGQDIPGRWVNLNPNQDANTIATAAGMPAGPWVWVQVRGLSGESATITWTSFADVDQKIAGDLTEDPNPAGAMIPCWAANVTCVSGALRCFLQK